MAIFTASVLCSYYVSDILGLATLHIVLLPPACAKGVRVANAGMPYFFDPYGVCCPTWDYMIENLCDDPLK